MAKIESTRPIWSNSFPGLYAAHSATGVPSSRIQHSANPISAQVTGSFSAMSSATLRPLYME